jgi:leader peptidase (prepilin peptidase)/N-methyltransferase
LIALIAGTFIPLMRLPEMTPQGTLSVLNLTSPNGWAAELHGVRGLGIAIFCFGGWCLALLPKITTTQFGWWRGFLLMIASMVRPPRRTERMVSSKRPFRRDHRSIIWLIGVQWLGWIWILAAWWLCNSAQWQCLLSQLFGMAVGGTMIWSIRIVGKLALGREAMGFGDVTLMAMIGAFIGWQPCVIIFALAPASAVAVALLQLLMTRNTEIAFGPYLALGTIMTAVAWRWLWFGYARVYFEIGEGWFVPGVGIVCLVLMGGMLWMIRLFKEVVLGVEDDGENGALAEPEA